MDKIIIKGLKAKCIIGFYTWERKRGQKIVIDIEMETDTKTNIKEDRLIPGMLDYNIVTKEILKLVEKSSFNLIETLAHEIAGLCLKKFPISTILVRLLKPSAIKAADGAIVEVFRKA